MAKILFDITTKNLYQESGAGNEGISVVPTQQVNKELFVGGDETVGGNLFIDGKIFSNGKIEMGAGSIDYALPVKVNNNLKNFSNYNLVSLGNQK